MCATVGKWISEDKLGSPISSSTTWVLGVELGLSGLIEGALPAEPSCQALSLSFFSAAVEDVNSPR